MPCGKCGDGPCPSGCDIRVLGRGEEQVEERGVVRWTIVRGRFTYRAGLEVNVDPDDSIFPPLWMEYHLHFLGVGLGYSVKARSRKRLRKKMQKAEREAL